MGTEKLWLVYGPVLGHTWPSLRFIIYGLKGSTGNRCTLDVGQVTQLILTNMEWTHLKTIHFLLLMKLLSSFGVIQ